MQFEGYPVSVTLKDGTPVTIRVMERRDGPALLEFFRSLPEEDRLFLRDDVTSPVWLERFVDSIDLDTVLPLIALQKDKVVGNGTLYRTRHGWSVHVGQFRIAVARKFQRKGLGTALARELVKLAIAFGMEKMTAEVVDNQVAAKRTLEKLGFHAEAVLKGHVKDIHGTRRDLVLLSNDVSHIWHSMEAMVADYSPSRD